MGNISEDEDLHFSLGSVAEKVSLHAPCSVLIVKRKTLIDKLLVAYDSSKQSKKTLKVAINLCKNFKNAKMTILNVENRELHCLEPKIAKEIGERILDEASTSIEGVTCDRRLEFGHPSEMILKISKMDLPLSG